MKTAIRNHTAAALLLLPLAAIVVAAPPAHAQPARAAFAQPAIERFTLDTRGRIEPGKELGKGPMNMFNNVGEYPPANFKGVVRPNFDTLYSVAYLDLTKEPVVVSVPDTNGRYYLLPMLDMWSDVFASPGWRTTGTTAQTLLVTPAGWRPDLRDRFAEEFKLPKDTQRIEAPTPYVWVIGRTQTNGPKDYEAVHKVQDGYTITPLSQLGRTQQPVTATIRPITSQPRAGRPPK